MSMLYRILALSALFFFTACGGDHAENMEPLVRKPANPSMIDSGRYAPGAPEMAMGGQPVPPPPQGEPVKTVKIGFLVPLSGESAQVGQSLLDAATLALMDKYGTVQSGNVKVKVVLVPKDTVGTPGGAGGAAQSVIDAGAEMIVGPLFSQDVKAVAAAARPRDIPVLSFSNNPAVAGNGVYLFGFMIDQQVRRVMNYALNNNLRQIAILGPNSPYGQSVRQSAGNIMKESSLSLAGEYFYAANSDGAKEVEELAAKHQGSAFNAILVPEGGQKLATIVNDIKAKGVNTKLLGTGLWDEPGTLRSGALSGGWFASSPPDRYVGYEQRFKQNFGYQPPRLSALAYDAMALAANLGMSSYGSVFNASALTDPSGFDGPVNGIFRCNANGICERGLAVLEVSGSSTKVIDSAPNSF